MEETKAQPVLEIGEVETQLLPKIVGKAGVIIYIYIYIYIGVSHGRD